MKRKRADLSGFAILKWFLLFAVVFSLSLPATAQVSHAGGNTYEVSVASGYLALRTQKSYDSANEIGQLYSGETVIVTDYSDSTYWCVYSPKYDQYGYVNKNNLVYVDSSCGSSVYSNWTVSVRKGYLALRSAKGYNSANEIGELYNGDSVEVYDTSDSAYWYVYSPQLCRYGYVNKDYLTNGGIGSIRTVSVSKGYLALRNAKSYDSANEIGELNSGDTVELLDTSHYKYWYVYSSRLDKSGYVNKDYLIGVNVRDFGDTRTVSVSKGYLALRSAKSYESANEIGQLSTGDVVELLDTTDYKYWYVYSSRLGINGYVNKDYLY